MNRGETCKGCEDKDECPFFDFDGWISKHNRICALSDFPVKCRAKKEARDGI
jgi:hypothetical protein